MRGILLLLPIIFLGFLFACISKPFVSPPPDEVRKEQNQKILSALMNLGQNGDWLVTRGYKTGDHMVVHATATPISHAALLDMDHGRVIEAETAGVHTTDLEKFVDKSHRVLLIRPVWSEGDRGNQAVKEAMKLLGKKYDLPGTLGINMSDAYYCSELCIYVYRNYQTEKDELPHVIEPGQLYLWGTVLYDSRPRRSSAE
jgi:hypothetical protein